MVTVLKWTLGIAVVLIGVVSLIWFANPSGLRDKLLVSQLVKMRVAPKRLENVKTPEDYGMAYKDVDLHTEDGIRLSAWHIPAPQASNKTVIVNHPITTTRYGSVKGLDGVEAEFLPMVKHLHEAGYNVVMYDHRGQGESDGGLGKTAKGKEAPVGAGVTEWMDVVASLDYVENHPQYGDDEIALLSQCMGANATFTAWAKVPERFSSSQIKALVANQPTISYNMTDRLLKEKMGLDLVDKLNDAQRQAVGFGYAEALKDVPAVTVPVLYAQVEKDVYTFNTETGKNDVQEFIDATPTQTEVVWIGPDQDKPYGTGAF